MEKSIKDILSNEKKFNEVAKVAFDSADTDKSGQIDASELEHVCNQMASDNGFDPPTKEDVFSLLKDLDKDKSGKLNYDEFKVFIKSILTLMLDGKLA